MKSFIKNIWPFKTHQEKLQAPSAQLHESLAPIAPEAMLECYRGDIERLQTAWSDANTWEMCREMVLRYGALVQRRPARASGIFSETDGLFLAGVRAASYALDVQESTVSLEQNIVSFKRSQTRLKGAVFASALFGFAASIIREQTIAVADADPAMQQGSRVFNPLSQTYYDWIRARLAENPQLKLQVTWNAPDPLPHESNWQFWVARHVFTEAFVSWVGEANRFALHELMRAITQAQEPEKAASTVIYSRDLGIWKACEMERERMGKKLSQALTPCGWERVLIRRLRARIWETWEVNSRESPLRKGGDGLFLYWPDVCNILIEDMKDAGLENLPTDPAMWAGCLLEAGITLASKSGEATTMIAPAPNSNPIQAIKLNEDLFVYPGIDARRKRERAFECEDLTLHKRFAMTRLNRATLEAAEGAFRDHWAQMNTTANRFEWSLVAKVNDPSLAEKLTAIAELLTRHPEVADYAIQPEGIILGPWVEASTEVGSLNLLSAELENAKLLQMTAEGTAFYTSIVEPGEGVCVRALIDPAIFSIAHVDADGNAEALCYEELCQKLGER